MSTAGAALVTVVGYGAVARTEVAADARSELARTEALEQLATAQSLNVLPEAAAVTAFYVLIVEVFIYRDIKLFSDVPRVMRESMLLVGAILMIIGTAMGLTNYLVDE